MDSGTPSCHHRTVTASQTALASATILTLLSAAGGKPPLAQTPVCPAQGQARLLLEDPQALFACAEAEAFADRIWAVHAHRQTGNAAEAAKLIEALGELIPPALRDVLAVVRAQALLNTGEAGAARKALPPEPSPSWLKAESTAIAARAALADRDFPAADRLAATAIALKASDEADLVRIRFQSALARDQKPEAARWLHVLRVEHPESQDTHTAEEDARAKLGAAAFKLSTDDYAARWRRLRWRGGAAGVGAECLRVAATLSGASAAAARFECGEALRTLRHAESETMLRAAASNASVKAKALLAIARVRGRNDEPAPVNEVCAELRRVPKAGNEQAECEYLAAFLQIEAGQRTQARAALEAIAKTHPRHTRADDALWMLALDDLRHDPPAAFARFDTLVASAKNAESAAQALYWRGRVRHAKEPKQAQADWKAVLARDPFGYYALLASARLGIQTAPGACNGHHEEEANVPADATLAKLLLETGFRDYAARELAVKVNKRTAGVLNWSAFLASAGQYRLLLDVGLAQPGSRAFPIAANARKRFEATYPLAFPHALDSVPASVDRCLVLSLMRQESRYDPNAVSSAQAHGLLQLLPSTAGQAASELGLPAPKPAELFEPALNIRLAGQYIHRLLERFEHPFLAAAAYNGGPTSVARWLKANEGLEIDEFVERIPYRETRHYVKTVAASWGAYGLVWAGARPAISIVKVSADAGGVDY